MLKRIINRITQSQSSSSADAAIPIPRLWMIMTALAIPFFIISLNYFEALEKTGPMGALIADMLLPSTDIAYVILIFVLKNRKI